MIAGKTSANTAEPGAIALTAARLISIPAAHSNATPSWVAQRGTVGASRSGRSSSPSLAMTGFGIVTPPKVKPIRPEIDLYQSER